MKAYEAVKDKVLEGITLLIRMPTEEIETISNPKVAEKVVYIGKTYNEELIIRFRLKIMALHLRMMKWISVQHS